MAGLRLLGKPGVSGGAAVPVLAPYTGPVANRFYFPTATSSTGTKIMSTVGVYLTEDVGPSNPLVLRIPCCASPSGDSLQTASVTYHVQIEYPAGVFTEIKWGGNSTITTAGSSSVDTGDCDPATTFTAAAGSLLKVHVFGSTASGSIAVANGTSSIRCAALGDASVFSGATATDQTGTGGVVDGGSGIFIFPLIRATTTKPTFATVGDSTTLGTGSTPDANGQTGEVAPFFGKSYAVLNVSKGGTLLSAYNTTGIYRSLYANFATHIINHYLKNDYDAGNGNHTAAVMQGDWDIFPYWFPGKVLIGSTIGPVTDSGNTTPNANAAARTTLNTYILSGSPERYALGAGVDLGGFMENGSTGLWKAGYTTDGLHENATSQAALAATGTTIVDPVALGQRTSRGFTLTSIKTSKKPIYLDMRNPAAVPAAGGSAQAMASQPSFSGTGTISTTSFAGTRGMTVPGTAGLIGDATYAKPWSNGLAAITLAALIIPTTIPAADRVVWGFTINGANSSRALMYINSAGKAVLKYRRLDADSETVLTGFIVLTANNPALIEGIFDPTNNTVALYVNGVADGTGTFASSGAFSATNSNNVTIATLSGAGIAAVISGLVAFDKALTTTERQKVEGDLAWKAGVAASVLPAGHPYLSAAPTS